MLGTLSAIASIASFLLTLFLERKKIASEIREIKTQESYKPKEAQQGYSSPTGGLGASENIGFLKSIVGIMGGSLGALWCSIIIQVASRASYAKPTFNDLFWNVLAILGGLWFGESYLRKKSWVFIIVFLLIAYFGFERLGYMIFKSIWY